MVEMKVRFLGWLPESSRDATERAMVNFPTLFIHDTYHNGDEACFGLYTDRRVDLSAFWQLRASFLANEKGK